jgi:adenylate cyclase
MPSSAFLAAGIGAVVAALGYAFWRAQAEAKHLRRRLESATTSLEQLQLSFARFAPQKVVERIIASGVSTSAEKKTVTVLFADIVGFTALSERTEPALLVQILNGYFARMSRAIAEHRGDVSKFIGDGILALFGALEPNPWQADDAVRAASAMREAIEEYNEELALAGQPALRVGIGLHSGIAVAGVIGCEELVEFTVIGSTVNLASRVEHLTRPCGRHSHHGGRARGARCAFRVAGTTARGGRRDLGARRHLRRRGRSARLTAEPSTLLLGPVAGLGTRGKGWSRRVPVVAACSGEGPFTIRFAA